VIARKLTQGTREPSGQRQAERLWSVVETARQQNVPVFAFRTWGRLVGRGSDPHARAEAALRNLLGEGSAV
jgi:hypothetical protein